MASRKADRKAASPVERVDIAVIDALGPLLQSKTVKAIGAIGDIGDQPPMLALAGATFGFGWVSGDPRLARTGARMIAAHLLATAVKTVGKDNVDRSRPKGMLNDGHYTMEAGGSKDPQLRSFPSGHSAGAMALASAVAREYPEHRGLAYAAGGAIGALQIPRRAHFPSDVIAGAAVGYLAELLIDRLFRIAKAGTGTAIGSPSP